MRRLGLAARVGPGIALTVVLASVLTPGAAAWAQVVMMSPVSSYYEWEYEATVESDYQFGAQTDDGGHFDVLRFAGRGRVGGPFSRTLRFFMEAGYTYARYDFFPDAPVSCSPFTCFGGNPWSQTNRVDLAPGASLVLTDGFQLQVIVPMQWWFESGAQAGSFTGGIIAQAYFEIGPSFRAAAGVGVQSELEASLSVFPVVALEWRITPGLSLETRGDPYQGGYASLVLGRSTAVQFLVTSGYERRRFRLARDPTDTDGVAQYTAVPVLGGLRIELGELLRLSLEGGVLAGGKLEMWDAIGRPRGQSGFGTAGVIRGAMSIHW